MNNKNILKTLLKTADLKDDVELRPHQKRAVDKIKNTGSLAVAHGTGTGKTLTSIAAIEEIRKKGKKENISCCSCFS